MEHGTPRPRPLIYGEVLFDCFPDGQEVMGGAPFNVAWHLQGLGAEPLFISRIGADARGSRVREAMRSWHMDDTGLQCDQSQPTGQVRIDLRGSVHSFSILPDQAYDRIDAATALAAVTAPPALLYYGSLITRDPVARATLSALRAATGAATFVDINLREPWWAADRVEDLLCSARWLKLNDEELSSLRGPATSVEAAEAQATALRSECGLDWVILTRGAAGASFIGDRIHRGEPPKVEHLVDTIGAGDGFSAVTILGLLHGWPMPLTLARALAFAARICAQRGATAADHALYAGLRRDWSL